MVANRHLISVQSGSFIAEHEKCVPFEWLGLNGLAIRGDLDSTNRNPLRCAVFSHFLQAIEKSCSHLGCGTLTAKRRNFILFARRLDQENFLKIECRGRSNNGSKVFCFLNVKHQHIALWTRPGLSSNLFDHVINKMNQETADY
jgi:hypothetical protein